MKTLKVIGTIFISVFFVAAAAEAAKMTTGPLFPGDGDNLFCEIVNVSAVPQDTRIKIIDTADGTVVLDSGILTLQPRTSAFIGVAGTALASSGYCLFKVSSQTNFRAGAKIATGLGSEFVFAPAQ